MTIHFGTDGWRAVISDTFTFHNLRLVTQAIADAVASGDWSDGDPNGMPVHGHRVVVGFDTRFLSDRYALEAARVLAANGFEVHLATADAPTPAISFAVKHLGAVAGLMITASHNAPRYNGLKLKAAYGGAAVPDQCRRVEVYLAHNEARGRGPNLIDYEAARKSGLIQRFNPTTSYYEHLRDLIDLDTIAENPQRLVTDSMYGSGRGQIKGLLQGTGCEVTEIRGEMNPGFGGIHPEPTERYLGALAGAIAAGQGDFGLATDGDADRIAAMDGRGAYVNPHRILALAFRYLVETRGMSGKVVKSISTTRMIDRLAENYDMELIETPVGFNHIADWMMRDDVLVGGEESGGMSFKGHIPEGDGVLMGLLLTEMVSARGIPLDALVGELLEDVGPSHCERLDQRLSRPVAKQEMVEHLTRQTPASIDGAKVKEVSTKDGVKYLLEDGSWLLIRPSGTEPVLRIYAEAGTQEAAQALVAHGQANADV